MSDLEKMLRQFGKFAIIGGLGFVVDSGFLYFGIYVLNLGHDMAALFSFPFAVSFTWIGNRIFTFREAQRQPALQQLKKFAGICAIGLVFNRGTFAVFDHYVPLVHQIPVIGLLAGTAAGMFFNFFATRRHVFGM